MFAVIRTGGKQYRVSENDRLSVEKLAADPGQTVRFDDVLMIGGDDGAVRVGAPVLDAAAVFAEVVEQKRDAKVLVFKKRRRKNSRRLRGHRQSLTVLRITGISDTGEAPLAADTTAAAEPAPEVEPAADEPAPVEPAAADPAADRPTADEPPADPAPADQPAVGDDAVDETKKD